MVEGQIQDLEFDACAEGRIHDLKFDGADCG